MFLLLPLFISAAFSLTLLAPLAGLVFLSAILPAFLIRLQLYGIPTSILELATYSVALAIVARIALDAELRRAVKEKMIFVWRERCGVVISVGLFFAAALIATLFSVDFERSLGVLKGWYLDPLIFGVLFFLVSRGGGDIIKVIAGFSVGAAVLSGLGIVEYFSTFDAYSTIGTRADSIFESPNYLAMLLAPIIAMVIAVLAFVRDVWRQVIILSLLLASLALNLVAFYLTFSYGGFVGLTLAVIWLFGAFAFGKMRNRKTIILIGAALAVILLLVAASSFGSAKFQRDFFDREGLSSFRGRAELWQTAVFIIKKQPLAGLGLGNYDKGYLRYAHEAIGGEPLEPLMIHAHNIFLDFWTDSGIIGLLAFLLLAGYFFKLYWSVRLYSPGLANGAAAAMIATLGHGLLDTPYFKNDLSYIFWFIIFIPITLAYLKHESRTKFTE